MGGWETGLPFGRWDMERWRAVTDWLVYGRGVEV
jgi:hypothetical protein